MSLATAGTALCLGSVLVLAWGWAWPCQVADPSAAVPRAAVERPSDPLGTTLPELSEFEPFWSRRLRSPLADSPAVAAATPSAVAPPKPPLAVKLLGTIQEKGRSVALFSVPGGKIELKQVGEFVGDPAQETQVEKIETERVTLKFRGAPVTLELKKKEG